MKERAEFVRVPEKIVKAHSESEKRKYWVYIKIWQQK
jgi:hypothetical protein